MSKVKKGQHGEPWEFVDSELGTLAVADGIGFSAPYRLEPGSGRSPRQVADTKRIVDCVNVLDGWDIEDVERALDMYYRKEDEPSHFSDLCSKVICVCGLARRA